MARVCEEFGCVPSVAIRELEDGPAELIWDIVELRAYARAKATVERATKDKDVPKGYWTDLVFDVKAEHFKRERGLGK